MHNLELKYTGLKWPLSVCIIFCDVVFSLSGRL